MVSIDNGKCTYLQGENDVTIQAKWVNYYVCVCIYMYICMYMCRANYPVANICLQ